VQCEVAQLSQQVLGGGRDGLPLRVGDSVADEPVGLRGSGKGLEIADVDQLGNRARAVQPQPELGGWVGWGGKVKIVREKLCERLGYC
jgi:hypothetical protein